MGIPRKEGKTGDEKGGRTVQGSRNFGFKVQGSEVQETSGSRFRVQRQELVPGSRVQRFKVENQERVQVPRFRFKLEKYESNFIV
jgi:hypothetical protein